MKTNKKMDHIFVIAVLEKLMTDSTDTEPSS